MTLLPAGAPASGHDNRLPATVRQVIYAGAATTYLLDGAHGLALRVFAQNRNAAPLAPGTAVTLGWPAAHTIPIRD